MVKAFEAAKLSAQKAKSAYQSKRQALHNLGSQLKASGHNISRLTQQHQKLGSSISKLKYHYGQLDTVMQRRQANLNRRMQLRSQIVDAVALGAALTAPLKAAIDFESAMADVRKVVEFKEPDGLKKLGSALKSLSREIPLSAAGLGPNRSVRWSVRSCCKRSWCFHRHCG